MHRSIYNTCSFQVSREIDPHSGKGKSLEPCPPFARLVFQTSFGERCNSRQEIHEPAPTQKIPAVSQELLAVTPSKPCFDLSVVVSTHGHYYGSCHSTEHSRILRCTKCEAHRYVSTNDSEILDHPVKHAPLVAQPGPVGRLGPRIGEGESMRVGIFVVLVWCCWCCL